MNCTDPAAPFTSISANPTAVENPLPKPTTLRGRLSSGAWSILISNRLKPVTKTPSGNASIAATDEVSSDIDEVEIPPWDPGEATDPDELVVISHLWEEIRRIMINYVGIARSNKRLIRANNRIGFIAREIATFYWDFKITPDLVELRNIATVAELIIRMARMRRESRGAHYNIDYPEQSKEAVDTVMKKGYVAVE